MRPLIKPALRRVWRDDQTIQFGVDPQRALVLGDVDQLSAEFIESLDGAQDVRETIAAAEALGLSRDHARRLLAMLADAGVLDDAATDTRPMLSWPEDERERLRPDLAACSLARRSQDGGLGALARRHAATVLVHGAGRVGASVASLLAAAGVGHVAVEDAEPVRLADVCPAGASAAQVGGRRQDAARRALRRAAPHTRVTPIRAGDRPDLVVLAPVSVVSAELGESLVAARTPHLVAEIREHVGTIGPLVLPGESSCLRCHDLIRRERDPAWPAVAAQLAAEPANAPIPCDTALAAAVAAHTTLHALSFLEGDSPPSVNGTIDVRGPHGWVRRRPWQRHPGCGCGWAGEPAGEPAGLAGEPLGEPHPVLEVSAIAGA